MEVQVEVETIIVQPTLVVQVIPHPLVLLKVKMEDPELIVVPQQLIQEVEVEVLALPVVQVLLLIPEVLEVLVLISLPNLEVLMEQQVQ